MEMGSADGSLGNYKDGGSQVSKRNAILRPSAIIKVRRGAGGKDSNHRQ
jgi:hypothetical protein